LQLIRRLILIGCGRQSLEWRKLYRIDTLLEDFHPPEVFNAYFSTTFFGYDKLHHPRESPSIGRPGN